jgi:hypothetical protein
MLYRSTAPKWNGSIATEELLVENDDAGCHIAKGNLSVARAERGILWAGLLSQYALVSHVEPVLHGAPGSVSRSAGRIARPCAGTSSNASSQLVPEMGL